MHLWAAQRQAGAQLTLDQLWLAPFAVPTAKSVGLCAPGHALVRHLFLAVSKAEEQYKFSWRQQNVGVTIAAVDASMKRGKALEQLKIRQTLWSCDVQAPLVAVFVASASIDDPGFTAACSVYDAVVVRTGLQRMQLIYLDCTFRDGPGAVRRFPHLAHKRVAVELDYCRDAGSQPALIDTIAACDEWVRGFDGAPAVELGLDTEHHAAQQKGDKPGKLATLQVVGWRGDQLVGAIFSLTTLNVVPPSLVKLLKRARLAGVTIEKSDLKPLAAQRMPAVGGGHQFNSIELPTLASDVLRLQLPQVASLEKVLGACCPGRRLNKNLVDVRRHDWEEWPMQAEAMRYAINDAYAGALAMRRLLHPDRAAAAAPPPPAAADDDGGGDAEDDAAAEQLLGGLDGGLHAQLFDEPEPGDSPGDDADGDSDEEVGGR